MALDPQIREVLRLVEQAGYPDYWELTPEQARAQFEKTAPVLDARPLCLFRIEDRALPGPAGPIPVRLYWPRESSAPLPLLVWLHGGGFVLGGLNSYDAICRWLSRHADCIVVSVDYRLAPEHKFPAAVEDSYAALNWVAINAEQLGGDRQRIAIAGDSAGGNLSAVTSILARDAGGPDSGGPDSGGPTLCQQILVYPCTAPEPETDSHHRYAEGYLLSRKSILWFHEHYLSSHSDRRDFRYAPLLAEDLSGLPPALIIVAGHDPLYDEGLAYARRLQEAGTPVELIDYPGMVHAFYSMSGAVVAAKDALQRSAEALRRAFDTL